MKTFLSSLDDLDVDNLLNVQYAIFVVSTTGQGENPQNMQKFWKFLLRRTLPGDILENLQFSLFGLGDSSY